MVENGQGQVGISKLLPQDLGSAAGFSSWEGPDKARQGHNSQGLQYQLKLREWGHQGFTYHKWSSDLWSKTKVHLIKLL